MHILFLSPRQCWPPVTGGRLREYHLAKALAGHAALTHVYFAEPETPAPEMPFCRKIIPVPAPGRYTFGKVLRGVLGRPLPVLNYYSREMCAALEAALESDDFDLIHLDSLHMGAYIPLLEKKSRAPIVFDWHNIESEAMRRYGSGGVSARKLYAGLTARRLFAFENYVLRKGMGHAVCSERERGELLRRRPSARIEVVENGVDAQAYQPLAAAKPRDRIVFVGSMDYYPNVDAAVFFVRSIWPRLHLRFPHWRFTIVGSNPAPAVQALRGEPGVEVTGTVPDVRPFYHEALATVVPLRSGGGTRLKILEAMAAGTPVVSTALGAEGLAVAPGENILFAESLEEWLDRLNALALQGDLWNRLSSAGRELAASRYDWRNIGESLYRTYCCWLQGPAESRLT